jgi:hypothetical protein
VKPLFHYSTWREEQIIQERIVKPCRRYAPDTMLNHFPPLAFLTFNPFWEPTIQAADDENRVFEKCGSCPAVYAELGIPCWRFEINPVGVRRRTVTEYWHLPYWGYMLDEAERMGSNPAQWRLADSPAEVIRTYQWNQGWMEVRRENRSKTTLGKSALPWWSSVSNRRI